MVRFINIIISLAHKYSVKVNFYLHMSQQQMNIISGCVFLYLQIDILYKQDE